MHSNQRMIDKKMRDAKRIDRFTSELNEIWANYFPDLRFFQFMSNVMGWIYKEKKIDPFFVEEDLAIKYLNEYAKKHVKLYDNVYRDES